MRSLLMKCLKRIKLFPSSFFILRHFSSYHSIFPLNDVLSTSSIIRIYGSEEAFFDKLAEMAMSEFPALKLLMEYAYGKPTERKEEVQTFNAPILENGKELPKDD